MSHFSTKQIVLTGLLGGFFINVFDVLTTVLTVANDWNKVLISQGITINPLTPAYYVSSSFVAGIILCYLIVVCSKQYGLNRKTALMCSILLWCMTRLYGMGHVVMGQMPLWIFAIMSTGLLVGFIAGGQIIYGQLSKTIKI
jgi:hypothetical protein